MPTKWPIPELDSTIPPNTIALEHPEFKKQKDYWEFFRHSDELTGGYKASVETYSGPGSVPAVDTTYLIPHIKETSTDDFARRVAAAKPPRFVKEGIESITGVLTQEEPNRENYPDKSKDWTSGVTAQGATLQQWISSDMWPLVERYGLCYSYARRPTVTAGNLAEQEKAIKEKGLPEVLLHVITPENMPWWAVDELGQFEIIRYTEEIPDYEMDGDYPTQETSFVRHWWITLEGWWYADDTSNSSATNKDTELKVLGVGTWNTDGAPMKHFPVTKWALKDEVAPTHAASFAQLAYYRKESELHVVEVAAAFPMTWVPTSSGDEDPEETVRGPHQIGGWDPESTGAASPMILETTGVSLKHFSEMRLPDLEEQALSPYGRQREVGGNDSGVALAHIQQSAIRIYQQHSKAGGMAEYAMMQPVSEMLDEEITDDQRAAWPRKFGTLSDASQAEILTAFWDLEPGEEFQKEILTKFAGMIGDMTADQLTTAIESWQSDKAEAEEREKEMEDTLFAGDGELRRAQTDKTDAEAKAVGQPFAANPASAKGPEKER